MQPLVLITETLDPIAADWLSEHARVAWQPHDQTEALAAALTEAQGLVVRTYTQVNADLLAQVPQLKVVGRAGVGLDNIDIPACRQRGVEVVHTPDANTQAVVEYVIGLILDTFRPRANMVGHVSPDEFLAMRKEHVGRQLDEMTLGIVGFGRVGQRLGRVAHAIGMKLLVNDLVPADVSRDAVEYPIEVCDKADLYARSDIVSIHVDGRASNRHMIEAGALSYLNNAALLINTSRGMVIDNDALHAWASRSHDAGGRAIIDVHDPEPPQPGYPLVGLPNVRLLPHLASRTDTAMLNMSWVVRDVMAVLNGESPKYPAPE